MLKRAVAIFMLLSAIAATVHAGTPGEILPGGVLRDVPMSGLSGADRKFSDFRGKPLVINVWASWCGPCRAEMGSLQRLSRQFGGKQFNVIGISTDDDRSAAAAFVNYAKITFPNYIDKNVVLENMLGANKIPLTVLVDADGQVIRKVSGSRAWDSPEAISLIGQAFRLKIQ